MPLISRYPMEGGSCIGTQVSLWYRKHQSVPGLRQDAVEPAVHSSPLNGTRELKSGIMLMQGIGIEIEEKNNKRASRILKCAW